MEEINPFTIREDTKPSYETDVAKWYLLKKWRNLLCGDGTAKKILEIEDFSSPILKRATL